MPKVRCPHCAAEFAPDRCRTRYCDAACYRAHAQARSAETLVARFWAKVNQTPTCWLWTAAQIRGYGQFHLPRADGKQRTVYAHRYAWTITNGPIADSLQVLHRCDVPLCVNPNHLFLGTQPDNLADARQKGRLVDGRHLIKVDDAGLRAIRAHYRPRVNGRELAAFYGITLTSLLRIVNGTQRALQPVASQAEQANRHHHVTGDVTQKLGDLGLVGKSV